MFHFSGFKISTGLTSFDFNRLLFKNRGFNPIYVLRTPYLVKKTTVSMNLFSPESNCIRSRIEPRYFLCVVFIVSGWVLSANISWLQDIGLRSSIPLQLYTLYTPRLGVEKGEWAGQGSVNSGTDLEKPGFSAACYVWSLERTYPYTAGETYRAYN